MLVVVVAVTGIIQIFSVVVVDVFMGVKDDGGS